MQIHQYTRRMRIRIVCHMADPTKRGSEMPYDTRSGRYFSGYRMITLKALVK